MNLLWLMNYTCKRAIFSDNRLIELHFFRVED